MHEKHNADFMSSNIRETDLFHVLTSIKFNYLLRKISNHQLIHVFK